MSNQELACTYAAHILHDDGIAVTADKISTICAAAGSSRHHGWTLYGSWRRRIWRTSLRTWEVVPPQPRVLVEPLPEEPPPRRKKEESEEEESDDDGILSSTKSLRPRSSRWSCMAALSQGHGWMAQGSWGWVGDERRAGRAGAGGGARAG